jgi:predicted ATPase
LAMVVVGRDFELADIDSWIGASLTVATGPDSRPTVLEIVGEAGIGKTTLWAEVGRRAASQGWTVLTCRPSASDAPLSFVGLADLLAPIPLSVFEALPAP